MERNTIMDMPIGFTNMKLHGTNNIYSESTNCQLASSDTIMMFSMGCCHVLSYYTIRFELRIEEIQVSAS